MFDKELRVSSRKPRNYVLRSVYLMFLTLFVILVWVATVRDNGSSAQRISRINEAGIYIIATIIMFQFFATQIITVVMLSTSISDEVYNRTLGVLMTTPITSFQIVMGKLFGSLLQLLLYLAITFPLLAIVRVFGGVPWDYVLSSFCITLTGIIFAASITLKFSIHGRRAYAVILKSFFTLAAIYFFIPGLVALFLHNIVNEKDLLQIIVYPNSFFSLYANTIMMVEPRTMGVFSFLWPAHCLIMLGLSAIFLAYAVKVVRRVALQIAAGQWDPDAKKKRKKNKTLDKEISRQTESSIKTVTGSPVIWKELRGSRWFKTSLKSKLGIILGILVLLASYMAIEMENELDDEYPHIAYAVIFVILGIVTNTVLAAATITSEKESRSWPILLATTLSDWQILTGKAVGVFRRCLPIWFLLIGHLVLFISIGYIHWIAFPQLAILVVGLVLLLCGSGLYFSARFKRTTAAVMANFSFGLCLWVIIPVLLIFVTVIAHEDDVLEGYMGLNPAVQTVAILDATGGDNNADKRLRNLKFEWINGRVGVEFSFMVLTITALIHAFLGFLFTLRAKAILRRKIF